MIPTRTWNSEATLALGGKLDLSEVDVFDLELLDGVSDRMAEEILESRDAIVEAEVNLADEDKWRAFLSVKHIGPARAQELAEFLSPSSLR